MDDDDRIRFKTNTANDTAETAHHGFYDYGSLDDSQKRCKCNNNNMNSKVLHQNDWQQQQYNNEDTSKRFKRTWSYSYYSEQALILLTKYTTLTLFLVLSIILYSSQSTTETDEHLYTGKHNVFEISNSALEFAPPLEMRNELNIRKNATTTNDDNTNTSPKPFSKLDPVKDLKLYPYSQRPQSSRPSYFFGDLLDYDNDKLNSMETRIRSLPTNQWYQNLLLSPSDDRSSSQNKDNRIYTIPYVIDAMGPIAGIRVCETKILGMEEIVQVTYIDFHGLTLGAARDYSSNLLEGGVDNDDSMQKRYTVYNDEAVKSSHPLTPLGITLQWERKGQKNASDRMMSSLVRGMPYGSMHYQYSNLSKGFFPSGALPTVASEIALLYPPVVDLETELTCFRNYDQEEENEIQSKGLLVKKSVTLSFIESDYSWLIFYSHPVYVRCYEMVSAEKDSDAPRFSLQAIRLETNETLHEMNNDESGSEVVFTSRIVLMNNCTRGTNPTHCVNGKPHDRSDYSALLHKHANVYPGRNTKIDLTFSTEMKEPSSSGIEIKKTYAQVEFDWDAHDMKDSTEVNDNQNLLMFALPHHRDAIIQSHPQTANPLNLANDESKTYCKSTLNGKACLMKGSKWILKEDLLEEPSFQAPREPMADTIPNLAEAINKDINFRVPEYYAKGAGDTYFSGKILAKFARILLITQELKDICSPDDDNNLRERVPIECHNITLPSKDTFDKALHNLKSSTEIWINGTAETPFVYDMNWGGLVSCGCLFNGETQKCDNIFPDCPAFSDKGLDFGHAFFNDHHFHQGYHIYAAATVAHFDHAWGREHFEEVLLLIRDFANPSLEDAYFPTYRMKDWYLGNSWAGGIGALYANGRNQESSSEAIAAYEAVSLFGHVMTQIWEEEITTTNNNNENISTARHICNIGRLLTATELRSANRYWHVLQSQKSGRVYPKQYKPSVVGMMWNMMAQFQTWFGNKPHLVYGIQLLPLTPIAEERDDIKWAKELYPSFAESCRDADDCDAEGWGILQHAILAVVGHPHAAIKYVESLPKEAFESAGGNGHSLTNSIWYYATRPETEPLELAAIGDDAFDCGCPETCNKAVLNSIAGIEFTCGVRIQWLVSNMGKSREEACTIVAGVEFKDICAGCDPNRCIEPMASPVTTHSQCPTCTKSVCKNKELNRCPIFEAPFVCVDGVNKGGCSMIPWDLGTTGGSNCNECCQLTYGCE